MDILSLLEASDTKVLRIGYRSKNLKKLNFINIIEKEEPQKFLEFAAPPFCIL